LPASIRSADAAWPGGAVPDTRNKILVVGDGDDDNDDDDDDDDDDRVVGVPDGAREIVGAIVSVVGMDEFCLWEMYSVHHLD
jgi:hypothetical protein